MDTSSWYIVAYALGRWMVWNDGLVVGTMAPSLPCLSVCSSPHLHLFGLSLPRPQLPPPIHHPPYPYAPLHSAHPVIGIYLLNLFLLFLQPKYDPTMSQNYASNDVDEDEDTQSGLLGQLPTTSKDDEFRPFIRKLPEFKFWYVVPFGCFMSSWLSP